MTSDTAIGSDGLDNPISGIDDEARARKAPAEGESVLNDDAGHDVTREDIEQGNDESVSADQLGRSPKTNKLHDDAIELGK